MKKIFAALMTLIMVATLCACASDHTLKFNGVWADSLDSSVLELREDGTAIMRLDDNKYEFYWASKDYDTIVLSVEIEEGDEPMFEPVFPEVIVPEDETTTEETTTDETETPETDGEPVPATEEAVVEETETTGEATEEEATTEEGTEESAPAQTTFNKKKYKIPVFEMTLSIRKGVMYLVIEEIEQDGIYYSDFSHLMEGVELNNPAQEYFAELSKKLKSIAFTKNA